MPRTCTPYTPPLSATEAKRWDALASSDPAEIAAFIADDEALILEMRAAQPSAGRAAYELLCRECARAEREAAFLRYVLSGRPQTARFIGGPPEVRQRDFLRRGEIEPEYGTVQP